MEKPSQIDNIRKSISNIRETINHMSPKEYKIRSLITDVCNHIDIAVELIQKLKKETGGWIK